MYSRSHTHTNTHELFFNFLLYALANVCSSLLLKKRRWIKRKKEKQKAERQKGRRQRAEGKGKEHRARGKKETPFHGTHTQTHTRHTHTHTGTQFAPHLWQLAPTRKAAAAAATTTRTSNENENGKNTQKSPTPLPPPPSFPPSLLCCPILRFLQHSSYVIQPAVWVRHTNATTPPRKPFDTYAHTRTHTCEHTHTLAHTIAVKLLNCVS